MRHAAEDTQLYQVITIDGDTLRYEARTAVGVRYDAFELRKRSGQPNQLVEFPDKAPERRRPNAPEAGASSGAGADHARSSAGEGGSPPASR